MTSNKEIVYIECVYFPVHINAYRTDPDVIDYIKKNDINNTTSKNSFKLRHGFDITKLFVLDNLCSYRIASIPKGTKYTIYKYDYKHESGGIYFCEDIIIYDDKFLTA